MLTALIACGRAPLPPRLAGLPRIRVVSGREAVRWVERLHGRSVSTAAITVGEYGRRGQLRVWVARHRDFSAAHTELQRMLRAMREHATPFERPLEDPRHPNRWITVGNGAHHLLWVSGGDLFWLEGTPEAVVAAAEELPQPPSGQLVERRRQAPAIQCRHEAGGPSSLPAGLL